MTRIVFIAVLSFLVSGNSFAQKLEIGKTWSYGTVRVSIPSLPYYSVDESDNNTEKYGFLLIGKGSVKQIPYIRRIPQKESEGNQTYHIDEYEVDVQPGVYRIVFNDFKNYKLPNFDVKAGRLTHFMIPQYRFAAEEVCEDHQRGIPLHGGENPQANEERLRHSTKLLTEKFVLKRPFEIVVQHCGRERTGDVLHYRSARMYYKNIFIDADDLKINKKTMTVEAKGSKEFPVEYQINGGKFERKQELVLTLNDN